MNMPLTENDIQQNPTLHASVELGVDAAEAQTAGGKPPADEPLHSWGGRLGQWAEAIGVSPHSPFAPRIQLLALVALLGINAIVAVVGASASNSSADYKKLIQPSWAPPGWLFGPVWTVLYILMAVAAWLVLRSGLKAKITQAALGIYLAQLIPNMLWTWIFFNQKNGAGAVVDIVVLWFMIAITIILFAKHSTLAAALLAPYICWVTFATVLTIAVWELNPDVLG